jgi:serine/threonine-protein kinase
VLFEMLAGRLPFTGDLPLAIANQHVRTPAPPIRQISPTVPAHLARIVDRALSKEPSDRHDSAAEMKSALTAPPAAGPAPTLIAPTVRIPVPAATHVMPTPLARRRRPGRRVGLTALGAVAALAAAAFALAGRGGGGTPIVALPRVVGMPVATAKSALLERGFDVRVGAKQHADRPAGTVIGIRPGGASAARGAAVTLIASSGPRQVVVPPVTGLSQETATAELERRGFVVHPTMAYASVPVGVVVATAPAAGTAALPQTPIALTVSAGPPPMPPATPVDPGNGNGWGKYKDKQKDKYARTQDGRSNHDGDGDD